MWPLIDLSFWVPFSNLLYVVYGLKLHLLLFHIFFYITILGNNAKH
jgi:hypothetical protein